MTPYQKHIKRWKNCSACELASQRSKVILARGKIPCDVLFIGEAPGVSEDVLGKPFVGPAGKLLQSIINRMVPEDVRYCLTNLVACYPKEAKETGNHEPPKECIDACSKRLRELVRICKPQAIVLVGNLPRKHVYGEAQFRLDGKAMGVEWLPTNKRMQFVEIIHPAAILRMDVSQQGLAIKRCSVAIATVCASL